MKNCGFSHFYQKRTKKIKKIFSKTRLCETPGQYIINT